MKTFDIHASIVRTTYWGESHAEHFEVRVQAMSFSIAVWLVRTSLAQQNPGASVFIDRDSCVEVAA